MANIIAGTDRLTNTIRLGTHYAMMNNLRDDLTLIIKSAGICIEIGNRLCAKVVSINVGDDRGWIGVSGVDIPCNVTEVIDITTNALTFTGHTHIF